MKKSILALITFLGIIFCNYPASAEPAPLTWVQMETEEQVSEVVLPANNKIPQKETIPAEQKEPSDDLKTKEADYLGKAIEEIMKRRREDDKLLADLLARQKEAEEIRKKQEKIAKEREEARKRQEEARKNQEQQKLIDSVAQTLQKQKDEETQKIAEILKTIADQQSAQNNNVMALINALKEEQSKKEQKDQEQPAVLNEITGSAVRLNNIVQTAPAPVANIASVKRTLQESIADSTQDATQAAYSEADTTFFYSPGSLYKIYTKEGFVTDIQLQPGEEIQYVGGGDTVRWVIDQAQSGSGNNKTWHIYLKPMKNGLATNFIINTDKHSYQLQVEATDWYTPIVKWTYPQEEKTAFYRAQTVARKYEEENLGAISLESLNFNYKITNGESCDWTPTEIFDDGTKTYIRMPEVMSKSNAPVLFVKDGKNLALVNYRLKNGMYVVDRLFKEAELRNGSEIVRIKKK